MTGQPKSRFVSVIRTPQDFVARLLARPRTIVSDDPIHYPPEYDALVNVDDGDRIRIRHYASPRGVASPILQLDLRREHQELVVECTVLSRHAPFSKLERCPPGENDVSLQDAGLEPEEMFVFVVGRAVWRTCVAIWNSTVWDLWLDAWLQRRAVAKYVPPLLALVKDVASEAVLPAEASEAGG